MACKPDYDVNVLASDLVLTLMAAVTMILMQHATVVLARPIAGEYSVNYKLEPFAGVVGCRKGDSVEGIRQVKHYLHQFGYLVDVDHFKTSITFDRQLETALKVYQENHHLHPTGELDAPTVGQMLKPRCGVPDIVNGTNYMMNKKIILNQYHQRRQPLLQHYYSVSRYAFFPGMPRWPAHKTNLTYTFSTSTSTAADHPVDDDLRRVAEQAFAKWAKASQFTFDEVGGGKKADIMIGYRKGDHGDGRPFDGPHGVLAHAFAPTKGVLHLDGEEAWSTRPGPAEMDLESVVVHEIGHILGLGHSSSPGAVMAPSIGSGEVVRELHEDDVNGIKALYML